MSEYVIRFVLGGIIVSIFAMSGDVLRPKRFAGLFSAAPSVALASLGLAIAQKGPHFAATQAQGMIFGAIALAFYSILVCQLIVRWEISALPATLLSLPPWFLAAFGLHWVFMGGE
jgi:hypothetical protein